MTLLHTCAPSRPRRRSRSARTTAVLNARLLAASLALLSSLAGAPAIPAQDGVPINLTIAEIQGAAHRSPHDRAEVRFTGVVTVIAPRGFYLESDQPDGELATSEGVYVDTVRRPNLAPGHLVRVTGRVSEEYPGGRNAGGLSVTTVRSPDVEVIARDRPLPSPVTLGTGGRIPPGSVITNDADGNVEESAFDPAEDAIDFYESLEGMRVVINDAVSVGTVHTRFGEIWVVPDDGAHASVRTPRGGIVVREGDFNPERILVDYLEDELIHRQSIVPGAVVGDRFAGPIHGVVGYSWYNYKVLPTRDLSPIVPALLPREVAASAAAGLLSVAAFNVQNLSGRSPAAKFNDLAETVVDALRAPDLVMLSEIQDGDGTGRGSGSTADTSSAATAARLLEALAAAGGPDDYRYVDIAPEYNQDGGAPHANIRVGFLYRSDRLELEEGSLERVFPDADAFVNSRKPLSAVFRFEGHTIHAVTVHFSSKSGDGALFGRTQPPRFGSEPARWEQARAVNRYMEALLADDPDALVLVGGDLNDFAFSRTLEVLKGSELVNLADELPPGEVYSYIYEGNSQALDHILVSPTLRSTLAAPVDYVHRYAEYLYEARHGDHDPVLARFRLPPSSP